MAVLVTCLMIFAAFVVMVPLTAGATRSYGVAASPLGIRGHPSPASTCGQSPIPLGSAVTYAALSGTTVTNTGQTVLTGDLGVSPGSAAPGFPPGQVTGTKNLANPASAAAEADLTVAYNTAAGRSNCAISVAGNIGGQTLTPGLYKSTSSLAISSGDLTLSGAGNPNGVFVFQVASALTTTSGRAVVLSHGAQAGNVYWVVGSPATIGTTSTMQGSILAYASITMLTGSHLNGRALARTGDVTLSATTIVVPTVSSATTYDVTFTETNLPAGTPWTVSLDGVMMNSSTTTIVFAVVDGSYPFFTDTAAAYTSQPYSGSVAVSGGPVSQAIAFAPGTPKTFSVTFTESGLPMGTSWWVTLNTVMKTSLTSTVVFTQRNGTTGYTVGDSSGYDVSPSSGSITVNGATMGQTVAFTNSSSGGGPSSPSPASPAFPSWGWTAIAIGVLVAIAAVVAAIALSRRRKRSP